MNRAARSYLAFLLVLLAAMLFAAVTSPFVQALLAPVSQFPLHRVFSRLMLLGMIVGTAWLVIRRYRDCRELLGFNRPWPQFLRRMLAGIACRPCVDGAGSSAARLAGSARVE